MYMLVVVTATCSGLGPNEGTTVSTADSILADIGMNYYATVDVEAYIHAAVKSELSSAESDTKDADAVPPHCGSPIRHRCGGGSLNGMRKVRVRCFRTV